MLKAQEQEIRTILLRVKPLTVKLLAYNVEETPADRVYSLVKRVIQDSFGIPKVWQRRPGLDGREVDIPASTLRQSSDLRL